MLSVLNFSISLHLKNPLLNKDLISNPTSVNFKYEELGIKLIIKTIIPIPKNKKHNQPTHSPLLIIKNPRKTKNINEIK